MDIQVSKNFIENSSCTVEETVLIINFDNSDDPNLNNENASLETNPTPVEEEIFENDSEEEPNKVTNSEINKVAGKPQFQQHRMDYAFASVSKQCDTQEESDQILFMTRQITDSKEEMEDAKIDEEKHTKGAPSMESEREQDLSESSSESDGEYIRYSGDEDADSDELDRKVIDRDLTCRAVDQLKKGVNLPRHHSDDLTLEEIEEQILEIELACSRKEACTREENTEPHLIRFHKSLADHGQDMAPITRVSVDVQNLISTETGSRDEDPDLPDRNHGRHVSFHSLEPKSGRVNPIPRHYYSEDSEHQKESEGNVKQDIPPRRDYRGLHKPEPVLATDHVMTHPRNIHEHDELRNNPLTTEGIQRPTNQIDGPENSTNRLEVNDLELERQDNQTGNKIDLSPEE